MKGFPTGATLARTVSLPFTLSEGLDCIKPSKIMALRKHKGANMRRNYALYVIWEPVWI